MSSLYIESAKSKLLSAVKSGRRTYLHVGGRLVGDEHAARVLPGYDPDLKLSLIESLSTCANFVYCISAQDIDRGRIRGDNQLAYIDESIRSINDLLAKGIKIDTLVIVGNPDSPYDTLKHQAKKNNINLILWNSKVSTLSPSFTLEHFEAIEHLNFVKDLVVILSPGSGSGKFDFGLQQLMLESIAGYTTEYIRLQIFPIPTLHPWHPVNLAYFAATADVYRNEELFTIDDTDIKKAWSFYQQETDFNRLLRNINGIPHVSGYVSSYTLSIHDGIVDENLVSRESSAELLRRYMRYYQEVKVGQEERETLDFTRRLVDLLLDQYSPD